MKTNLFRNINNENDAKQFLEELHINGESYHPEDDAHDIIFDHLEEQPTHEEKEVLNMLMDMVWVIDNFDPCEFLLSKM